MKKFKILIPKKHNKGAAMISIMLAVAFISIVTSAMLLISLNNYEMKLTQAKSKKNFYYNEKYINIVTSVARSEAKGDQSPETKIKAKMCTNSTDNQYKAYKIMDILEPGVDHSTSQSGNKCIATLPDGNQVTTYDGNVKVYDKNNPVFATAGATDARGWTKDKYTSGSVVVLEGVTVDVQSADAEKYKNTIKTDIEFYLQYSSGSSGGASIGECSFLMDNSITIEDGKPCRVQVYGNSIIGKYVLSGGKSVGSTALNLKKNAYYTILGDYTVIYGDIVLNDTATFNIVRGNVSVFGDIYVNDNSSFMCNGKLKLGPGRKIIYHNDSTHPVTATDKNKNIIINGAITYLSNSDESTIRSTLNLDDNDLSNDGVLYNIIDLNDSKSPSKYFYNMSAVNHADSCDALNKFYFDGIKYDISVLTQDNLNCGNWDNMLVFACKNNGTSLHESNKIIMDYTCQNSTIISSRPLYVNETHSVTVSQMGKAEFNYILAHPEIKISGYSVKDFFVDDPNSVVSTIFSTANGGSSSVSTCEKTAANYVKWSKQ